MEADLVREVCGAHGRYKTTAEVCDIWRIGGGRGLRGGPGKRVDRVFPGRPQSFRYQRRQVDDCSPGRGGMAQDGGTRGGTFHGEINHCKESQGWTTACSSSSMSGRDGKDQRQDSPKQAGSCAGSLAIVDKPQVARTCILGADVVLSFSGVTFVFKEKSEYI